MVKNEIIVGRQVGKDDFLIDDSYKEVSRRHCRILRKADGIYIEDLNSANGTFVNGKEVVIKKVSNKDLITLGGEDGYELKLDKVLNLLPMSDKEFAEKFLKLKDVYEKYQKTKVKIQSESQASMMMKRTIPMAVPSLLMVVIGLVIPNDSAKYILSSLGGILSAVAMIIGGVGASKSMAKLPERLAALREQFMLDYVCPACGREYGERPWENIKRQGKCPYCGREFNFHNEE
jgi:DNA-directed RNA polymerase subunit RPC12/RpoP